EDDPGDWSIVDLRLWKSFLERTEQERTSWRPAADSEENGGAEEDDATGPPPIHDNEKHAEQPDQANEIGRGQKKTNYFGYDEHWSFRKRGRSMAMLRCASL
ncbi:hypothetical protein, partial [Bauldia litoralis]